jgi:hypothetical protein
LEVVSKEESRTIGIVMSVTKMGVKRFKLGRVTYVKVLEEIVREAANRK